MASQTSRSGRYRAGLRLSNEYNLLVKGGHMKMDIRTPIGLMFSLMGIILALWGIISDPTIYSRSLGININLWWGIIMTMFGLIMLGMAWMAGRQDKRLQ
jgi:hypothetical protein